MPRGKTYSPADGSPGRDPRRDLGRESGRPHTARVLGSIDRWLLKLVAGPLAGALGVTLTALLLERALRLMTELAGSNGRWTYLAEMLLTLTPHYLGLTLPAAFFLALFLVFARLSDGSEIDALMAAGLPLDRIAAPFLVLGGVLGVLSLALSGWAAPEGRFAFRFLGQAAQAGGWNGAVPGGAFAAPSRDTVITADAADVTGRLLQRVWIRQVVDGEERVTTARQARLRDAGDGRHELLALTDGRQVWRDAAGRPDVLAFKALEMQFALPALRRIVRSRGDDEREMTLDELTGRRGSASTLPPRRRASELYGRIARALALPLLPLLAVPLSLAAKRGGRVLSGAVAAGVLFGFLHLLQLGQSLGSRGKLPAWAGVGGPFLAFAAVCLWIWIEGRRRPGDTPVGRAAAGAAAWLARLRLRSGARGSAEAPA